ncbi:MAG: hypothetical protein ACI8WB_004590 [Phenylobacterium sp.]|jgi:uncharacterized protein (TIGR02687 family)
MQIEQLELGLSNKFSVNAQQRTVVFWYDPAHSFAAQLEQLALPQVAVLNMAEQSTLEVKKWILRDHPEQSYLLYFPYAEPKDEDNWLLDISCFAEQFYADHAAMLLNALGIKSMAMREHIHARERFFASQTRIDELRQRITESEDAFTLDLKMIAVLAMAEPTLNNILMALFGGQASKITEQNRDNLPLITDLAHYDLLDAFWRLCHDRIGYVNMPHEARKAADTYKEQDQPGSTQTPQAKSDRAMAQSQDVQDLLYKLFCTELCVQTDNAMTWAQDNIISSASGRAYACAFMHEWRDSKRFSPDYDIIAKDISDALDITSRCAGYSPLALQACYTFEAIEQEVIRGLVQHLIHDVDEDNKPLVAVGISAVDFENAVSKRLSGHWSVTINAYGAIYQALKSAAQLFKLRQQYAEGFNYPDARSMFTAYSEELFLFDKHYRLFNQFTDQVQSKGGDVLRQMDEAIENLYVDWYLYESGLAWDKLLEANNSLEQWRSLSPHQQTNFYNTDVRQPINNKSMKRMFVIISDAMRYEVAHELMEQITDEKRFKPTLKSMVGVLPSYTQLGMAALLPHQRLDYASKNATVLADGKSTSGIENRNRILQAHGGIAVSAKDFLGWTQKKGRDEFHDKAVVYIYHDTIDALGDKAPTEHKTFEACRDAVVEINDLVKKLINNLNVSRVLVTADHGFLYQQKSLTQPAKTGLGGEPEGTFEAKKRYILGRSLPKHDLCWHGSIANTVATAVGSDVEFLLPKGANRFHFIGGAKFVHGGAMLQEICLPILEIQMLRGKKADQNEKVKVGIIIEKPTIRFVNQIEKVRFTQTNAVGGSYIERKVTLVIRNNKGEAVSSEETLLFDATSGEMSERTREARFKLIGSQFNRNENYQLFVIDSATGTVVEHFPRSVMIDLLDRDDFGF